MKAPPPCLLTQVIYAHKRNKAKRAAASFLRVFFFWMTQRMSCVQTAQAAGEKLLSFPDPEVVPTVVTDANTDA